MPRPRTSPPCRAGSPTSAFATRRSGKDELRGAIEELYYRYYGARLSDIDPIEVIREALSLIYSFNLRLPTRFVILDKAIATLGAVGVELYPDFNVFEVAKPYARGLMAERFSPRRISMRAQREARELARVARDIPYQVHDVLDELRDGELKVKISNPGIDDLAHHIDVSVNRIAVALVILGGLVGSSLDRCPRPGRAARDRAAPALGRRVRPLRASSASGCSGASSSTDASGRSGRRRGRVPLAAKPGR